MSAPMPIVILAPNLSQSSPATGLTTIPVIMAAENRAENCTAFMPNSSMMRNDMGES